MVEEVAAKEMKAVCFNLGNEEFGLDVTQVLGVNPMMEIIHVPKAPDFVEGVIRIRERVIPVIDLRKRLGMETIKYSRKKRIVIAKVGGVRLGIVVDGVSSVIDIPTQNVEPPSDVLDHASLLKGVGKLEERLLLLLDLEKIISREETESLADIHKEIKHE